MQTSDVVKANAGVLFKSTVVGGIPFYLVAGPGLPAVLPDGQEVRVKAFTNPDHEGGGHVVVVKGPDGFRVVKEKDPLSILV